MRGLSRISSRNGPRVAAAERDLAHAVALYLAAGLTEKARELSTRFLPSPGMHVRRGGGFLSDQPTLPLPEPKVERIESRTTEPVAHRGLRQTARIAADARVAGSAWRRLAAGAGSSSRRSGGVALLGVHPALDVLVERPDDVHVGLVVAGQVDRPGRSPSACSGASQ